MKNVMIIFMGAYVFNNEIFDSWLNKKSEEILSKVDRERITTEEMIILVLKAQTNHFHHMDVDMKSGLDDVRNEMKSGLDDVRKEMKNGFDGVNNKFDQINLKFESNDRRFEAIDQRFEKIDQRFEKMDQKIDNRFMWTIGITIAMSGGIYLKLFFG